MFRQRKSIHIGINFGNDSDIRELTTDIRSDEHKNDFFKSFGLGVKIFIMIFNYFGVTILFRSDIAVNGIMKFSEYFLQIFIDMESKLDFPQFCLQNCGKSSI